MRLTTREFAVFFFLPFFFSLFFPFFFLLFYFLFIFFFPKSLLPAHYEQPLVLPHVMQR